MALTASYSVQKQCSFMKRATESRLSLITGSLSSTQTISFNPSFGSPAVTDVTMP